MSRAAEAGQDTGFWIAGGILFLASAALTVRLCAGMSGGMAMPGGWTMSMAWMPIPGQSAWSAAASFFVMWVAMMAAMMIPSLIPALAGFRRALREEGPLRRGARTAVAALGYFFVWGLVGIAAYAAGVELSAAAMRSPAVSRALPAAGAGVLLLAGLLQLSPWKGRLLSRCLDDAACGLAGAGAAAWRHGMRLGARCALCCAGYTAALLVIGVMDLRAMALVGAAISAERLGPRPFVTARATGIAAVAAGVLALSAAWRSLLRT